MKSLPILLLMAGALLWFLAANALLPVHAWPDAFFPAGERTIEQIRLVYGLMPRAGVAVLVGAALGLAGSLLQRVLRNPEGSFQLFRIGDAISARNTHAAIHDALRLVKDL